MKSMLPFMTLLLVSWNVQAATSASIVVTGTVQSSCSVAADVPTAGIDLVSSQSFYSVGNITTNCNFPHRITIASVNNGNLRSSSNANIPFSVNFMGVTQSISTPWQIPATASASPVSNPININLQSPSTIAPGSYTDTITVSIAVD